MPTLPLTIEDARDPVKLLRFLQSLNSRVEEVRSIVKTAGDSKPDPRQVLDQTLAAARVELGSRGRFPLDLTGLHGQLAEGQSATVPTLPADPTNPANNIDANLYEVDTLYTFGGTFYRVAAGNPHTWAALTLSVATHNLLSATHTDTVAGAPVRGSLIVGDATPKWNELPIGAAFKLLRTNAGGTDPEWGGVDDSQLSANVPLLNASNLFTGLVSLGGKVRFSLEAANATPYTISGNHFIVGTAIVGAVTVKLTATPAIADAYIICDARGQAGTNNLTVDGNGANINAAPTFVISTNFGAVGVFWTGSVWETWCKF